MPGSNRSGDERSLVDRRRRRHIRLPVNSVRVSRRVSAEQVSSYNLRVHSGSSGASGLNQPDMSGMLDDRDIDPGEAELLMVPKPYQRFLMDSAKNRPDELLEGLVARVGRLGQRGMSRLLAASIGLLVHSGRSEEMLRWLPHVSPDQISELGNLIGRSTWRHLVRMDGADQVIPVFGYEADLIGEVALNSNTMYRQGTDVLKHILPHIDNILDTVDHVDLGHQQVFSTRSPNLIPSSVYPLRSYGASEVSIAGSSGAWMYSPSKRVDTRAALEESLGLSPGIPSYVHVRPLGVLPRSKVQALKMTPSGLVNSSISIPWELAQRVLSGVRVSNVTLDKHTVVSPLVGLPYDKQVDELRQKLFRLTSRKMSSIHQQVKEYGSSGFGNDEIDIYNRGQYRWIAGRRSLANEQDILDRVFPHPLIRLISMDYRELDHSDDIRESICRLSLSSLPLVSR